MSAELAYDLAQVLRRGDRVDWRFSGEVRREDGLVIVVDRPYAWVHFAENREPCKYPIHELYPSPTAAANARLDKAVKQATWKISAFGAKAELRRMWSGYLKRSAIPDDLYRWIISYWHHPPTDGYAG